VNERWIPLDVADCDENPFVQFRIWYDEGLDEMDEREAITLVSASANARPSARMVLLRHIDATSFGWFTNYNSRKGRELAENPYAALLWYCEPFGRQIRIEGAVAKMDPVLSDRYFASRPRGHQIGAHASAQSEPLSSRAEFDAKVHALTVAFEGKEIARPKHWGGYRLSPDTFEFWQRREDRLHDRVLYVLDAGVWRRERLSP
jgi:pyridoxamine 5'-phosphate oxidase